MAKDLPHVRIPCSWIRGEGSRLSSTALHLYLVMLSYRDKDDGICYTGQRKLGDLINVKSVRHIRKLTHELEALNLIELVIDGEKKRVKSKYRTNQYFVHNPMDTKLITEAL